MKRTLIAGLSAGAVLLLAGCGSSSSNHTSAGHAGTSMSGMSTSMPGLNMSTSPSSSGMGGMNMSSGNGLAGTANGYTLTIHSQPMSGMAMPVTFTITKDGKTVTRFDSEQTKLMHFYLIRDDLSGLQHLHPTMDATGTWSVTRPTRERAAAIGSTCSSCRTPTRQPAPSCCRGPSRSAAAHHPAGTVNGDRGGPTLIVNADLPEAGAYRISSSSRPLDSSTPPRSPSPRTEPSHRFGWRAEDPVPPPGPANIEQGDP